ncbi:MAG: hypothetical protein FWG10_06000 [Eubacteriaceae bacterium]|nr:hypothetical protein [Eubacteriaceae bacterium]
MKKRIITGLLVVCLLIGASAPAMARPINFNVNMDGKGVLQLRHIHGEFWMTSGGKVVRIPICDPMGTKLVVVAINALSKMQKIEVVKEILVKEADSNFEVALDLAAGQYEIRVYGSTVKEYDTLFETIAFTVVK